MKTSVRIFLSALMLLCSISLYAEHRFFPANSIRCANVTTERTNEYDPVNNKYKTKYIYYHYETGNDTIVDGKPCVMLWKYCSETPKEKELRFLCEENGLVSYKYPLAEGGYSDWTILFEFPEGGWIEGESYTDGYFNGEPSSAKAIVSTCTLLNGEEIQTNFGKLMYGIGYNDWPFFEYREYTNGASKDLRPFNFYRNDTLLWGKPATHGPFFPAHSIRCTNMVTSLFSRDTTYYNIYTGGDTIVDGKECVQLWHYCTDTPEELEMSLLHEVDDKVYIRYTDDGEWNLLYDFSLPVWHVGDSIEHAESYRIPIESVDTITMLNGKKRQVANGIANGGLIHGIGRAYYSYFNLPYSIAECQSSHPVSFYYWNQLLLGKELPKEREDRFFPANEVYTSSRLISHSHNFEDFTIEFDTIDYNIWTGNDTIVDGRQCVTLWSNSTDTIKLYGLIYESLNGVVYFNWWGEYRKDWLTLYDFTPRRWKPGDKICLCSNGLDDEYVNIDDVSSVTLHNGEKVPFIILSTLGGSGLIYGIGYNDNMFFSPEAVGTPLSFYRNGVLLWGKEEQPGNSVVAPMVNKVLTPYYDLQGRPVAAPTRGIYIKDGRKVIFK